MKLPRLLGFTMLSFWHSLQARELPHALCPTLRVSSNQPPIAQEEDMPRISRSSYHYHLTNSAAPTIATLHY